MTFTCLNLSAEKGSEFRSTGSPAGHSSPGQYCTSPFKTNTCTPASVLRGPSWEFQMLLRKFIGWLTPWNKKTVAEVSRKSGAAIEVGHPKGWRISQPPEGSQSPFTSITQRSTTSLRPGGQVQHFLSLAAQHHLGALQPLLPGSPPRDADFLGLDCGLASGLVNAPTFPMCSLGKNFGASVWS